MVRPRSLLGTLRKLFGDSAHPIWILDAERTLAYANTATERWLQVASDQLVGQRCDYSWSPTEPNMPSATAPLAAPPEAYATAASVAAIAVVPQENGISRRYVTFMSLHDERGNLSAVLAIAGREEIAPSEPRSITPEDEPAELHRQLGVLRSRLGAFYHLDQLVGLSPAMERVREQIKLATASKVRTLIEGPPGSGREQVARTIYYHQVGVGAGTLVPLSCALLDAELLQSTLAEFIHAQPEFSVEGPVCFLLLDADQLTPEAQTAVMAVVNIIELEAHTLTTTSKSLIDMAREGSFRPDLANHLSTLPIQLPPLAARPDDIPLAAHKMLEDLNAAGGRQWSGFSTDAMDQLVSYAWPGNLDELRTVVREACQGAASARIELTDLPEPLYFAARAVAHPRRAPETIVLDEYLARIEAELIRRALRRAKGNRSRAARLLGISRPRLLRRIEQLKLT